MYYNYKTGELMSDEMPGLSVFYKDESSAVFHTYSTYARGLDMLVGTYHFLDLVPKGRDENRIRRWIGFAVTISTMPKEKARKYDYEK